MCYFHERPGSRRIRTGEFRRHQRRSSGFSLNRAGLVASRKKQNIHQRVLITGVVHPKTRTRGGGGNLQPVKVKTENWGTIEWIDGPLARVLLRRKHALPVMLAVYDSGVTSTSDLIRRVHGHPESVISTIRSLQQSGVLSRARSLQGRHEVQTRLTLRGIQLVETPIYRWQRLLLKWNRASDEAGSSPGT